MNSSFPKYTCPICKKQLISNQNNWSCFFHCKRGHYEFHITQYNAAESWSLGKYNIKNIIHIDCLPEHTVYVSNNKHASLRENYNKQAIQVDLKFRIEPTSNIELIESILLFI